MTTPKALVTGAAGFIGSHIADHCLSLGMDVTATDDLSGGFLKNVPAGARWIQGDLRSPDFAKSLWNDGPFTYVYHAAAYAAEVLSHHKRDLVYRTNILASANLIQEAIKHRTSCFVFVSSIAVYGENQLPMTETLTPQPLDPYGISKYATELDLNAAYKAFELPFIIFRPHNVYGEKQNILDPERNVIGIFMNQIMNNLPLTLFGDGNQTRAFSYINDVAPIIAQSPLFPKAINNTFNIGSDTPHTVLEVAKEVALSFGKPCIVKHLPERKEVYHAFADHQKVRAIFTPPGPVNLKEGIQRMAQWAQNQ